ncbi:MAG TPA: hypothetical protein VH741_02955, partial [Candidatus Limnocylindrales bacterium]
ETDVDAAAAVNTVDSRATLVITGTSVLNAGGAANLTAENLVEAQTVADGSNGGSGAAVAVATVTGDTVAAIDGSVGGTVGSLALTAKTERTLTTSAKSTPGGSEENTATETKSEKALKDNNASTTSDDSGDLKFAGAVAVTTLVNNTQAYLVSTGALTSTGAIGITATNKATASTTADGSQTAAAAEGVGIAVAIAVADLDSTAYVGNASLTSTGVTVSALVPESTFAVSATSGAGDTDDVAVAGSLAINVVLTDVNASVADGATLDLNGGSLVLTADSRTDVSTSALPKAAASASDGTGVGASVALTIADHDTHARIGNNAALGSVDDLTLSATSDHEALTKAKNGAAGDTAVTPVVAISTANSATSATIGTGMVALDVGGDLGLQASHSGSTISEAEGSTETGDTGVGISIALTFATDDTLATSARDLDVGGALAFGARTVSSSRALAKASVAGGSDDSSGDDEGVDKEVDKQRGFADSKSSEKGAKDSGSTESESAETSGGGVSVAGAVAMDLANSTSRATFNGAATAVGAVELKSQNMTNAVSIADGSATTGDG